MDFYDILGITQLMEWGKKTFIKKEYHPDQITPTKFQFRPRTLDEFIGNEEAKENIILTTEVCLFQKPCHILLSGNAGHGKTTLAKIIGNMMGLTMNYYIGGSFTMENLRDFLLTNEKEKIPQILMIDEIHGTKKEVLEFMLPIIEDFKLGKANLRPFILIGATTNKSILLRTCHPFVDRIGCQIQLSDYKTEEIKKILIQYNDQIYKAEISDEVYQKLAENTRFCPRIALAWMDMFIVCKDINRVLKINNVVKDGLTQKDIFILNHLKEANKPCGEQALSAVANVERLDYVELIEPYLLRQGYISRGGRGRFIIDKGIQLLNNLKGV